MGEAMALQSHAAIEPTSCICAMVMRTGSSSQAGAVVQFPGRAD